METTTMETYTTKAEEKIIGIAEILEGFAMDLAAFFDELIEFIKGLMNPQPKD